MQVIQSGKLFKEFLAEIAPGMQLDVYPTHASDADKFTRVALRLKSESGAPVNVYAPQGTLRLLGEQVIDLAPLAGGGTVMYVQGGSVSYTGDAAQDRNALKQFFAGLDEYQVDKLSDEQVDHLCKSIDQEVVRGMWMFMEHDEKHRPGVVVAMSERGWSDEKWLADISHLPDEAVEKSPLKAKQIQQLILAHETAHLGQESPHERLTMYQVARVMGVFSNDEPDENPSDITEADLEILQLEQEIDADLNMVVHAQKNKDLFKINDIRRFFAQQRAVAMFVMNDVKHATSLALLDEEEMKFGSAVSMERAKKIRKISDEVIKSVEARLKARNIDISATPTTSEVKQLTGVIKNMVTEKTYEVGSPHHVLLSLYMQGVKRFAPQIAKAYVKPKEFQKKRVARAVKLQDGSSINAYGTHETFRQMGRAMEHLVRYADRPIFFMQREAVTLPTGYSTDLARRRLAKFFKGAVEFKATKLTDIETLVTFFAISNQLPASISSFAAHDPKNPHILLMPHPEWDAKTWLVELSGAPEAQVVDIGLSKRSLERIILAHEATHMRQDDLRLRQAKIRSTNKVFKKALPDSLIKKLEQKDGTLIDNLKQVYTKLEREIDADRGALTFAKAHPRLFADQDLCRKWQYIRVMNLFIERDLEHPTALALDNDAAPNYGTRDSFAEASEIYLSNYRVLEALDQRFIDKGFGNQDVTRAEMVKLLAREARGMIKDNVFAHASAERRLLSLFVEAAGQMTPSLVAGKKNMVRRRPLRAQVG